MVKDLTEDLKKYQKPLILLEHEEQVKNSLKLLKELKGKINVIALSPFAIYELDKQHIQYNIPEDYYDLQELYDMGVKNYGKVENICKIIDGKIHKNNSVLAKLGIKPALFSFYRLKILYDSVSIRLFQLTKIIEKEKPDIILTYDTRDYPFTSGNVPRMLFDNRESIYTKLLKLGDWEISTKNLPYIPEPKGSYPEKEKIKAKLRKKVLERLQGHPLLYSFMVKVSKKNWRGACRELKSFLLWRKKAIQVLLIGGAYNWTYCNEKLLSVGIIPTQMKAELDYWFQVFSKPSLNGTDSAWEELQEDKDFRGFFIYKGIDFFPLLKERIRFIVQELAPLCLSIYKKIEGIVKSKKIKAVFTSTFSSCVEHTVAKVAHNNNIPVIVWQHGAFGMAYTPILKYLDLMSTNYYFTYGIGVIEKYSKEIGELGVKPTPTGSALLDRLLSENLTRREEQKTDRKVLYVTTNYYQNHFYVSFSPPFSDNKFWHVQRSILDVLGSSSWEVIVKLHPNRSYREPPLRYYAKDKGFKNIIFIRDEKSFTELLKIASVVIIDWPVTTLLQALTTLKPIFVYTGHLNIDREAEELLKKRAYCYSELDKLIGALKAFLSYGKLDEKVDLNNREFLKNYGIYLEDGKSCVRTANMILEIISRKM